MAKARILEITLSVIGTAEDGPYPKPDMLQIPSTASTYPDDANVDLDLVSRAIGDSGSGESLVILVRIRGAKNQPRYRPRSGGWM